MKGYSLDAESGIYRKVHRIASNGERIWVEDYDEEKTSVHRLISAIPSRNIDWAHIEPRRRINGTRLLRGQVAVLTGAGGVGKTAFTNTIVASLALGENLLDPSNSDPALRLHLKGRQKVYCYNLEDDLEEAKRRFKAVLLHYGKDPTELNDHLWLGDGTSERFVVAALDHATGNLQQPCVDALKEFIRENGISVLVINPFVKAHKCSENDNNAMDAVMSILKEIAIETGCAIWLLHHAGKAGTTFDANGARGASSIISAARVSETLSAVTAEDRQRFGFSAQANVVKLLPTKMNLSLNDADAVRWFEIVSWPLGNGAGDYPDGDSAQVLNLLSTAPVTVDRLLFTAMCNEVRTPPTNSRTSGWLNDRKHENDVGTAFKRAGIKQLPARIRCTARWIADGLLIPDDDATGSQGRRLTTGVKLNEIIAAEHLANYP